MPDSRINILLVDDQPAKLLSYEVILSPLGENLIKATSAREALEQLLKLDIGVIIIDVCMPELDGFELAELIRGHPRYQETPLIFVSGVMMGELDRIRGYAAGAVDYVPVPIVPEVLRAKVRIFVELHRKTRALERLNAELEARVAERTVSLEASAARLRESERRRSLALSAARMGSWDFDFTSKLSVWDEGQRRIFGVAPGDPVLTREAVGAMIEADDYAQLQSIAAGAIASKTGFDAEIRIRRGDGEMRWCVISAAPSFDEEGHPVRISGVTFDITERKRAEQDLQRLNEGLEQRIEDRTREREQALAQLFEAQKMETIGQLTGSVAHDFNNLLMAVLGSLDLLRKRMPKDPRADRLLSNAIQGAERGAALTQRLLAFARRQELRLETVDLGTLVTGIRDLLERAAEPGIRVAIELPAALPAVCADPNQLELALLNLVVNARDAMPLGGTITIEAEFAVIDEHQNLASGSYVCLRVVDTGLGMDEATLARATEPFYTTKGVGKGTGLGLSMVHGLAAQSGGLLELTSAPGEGTSVCLWLPQATEAHAAEGVAESPGDGLQRTRACTILIVDDDELVNAGTVAMVEDMGHCAIEAFSGPDALARIECGEQIDLVLTDHVMPGMTGLEFAKRVRMLRPMLPIILTTGYVEISHLGDSTSWLPRLTKPFRQIDLAKAIANEINCV